MSDAAATLEQLAEIPLPAPVPYTPQTIGWLVVAILLVACAGYLGWRLYKRRAANQYRRAALEELAAIVQRSGDPSARSAALAALPALVKRTALACEPRAQIASLSATEWLAFLDRTLTPGSFTSGPGALLQRIAYDDPSSIPDDQIAGLVALLQRWIERHHARV